MEAVPPPSAIGNAAASAVRRSVSNARPGRSRCGVYPPDGDFLQDAALAAAAAAASAIVPAFWLYKMRPNSPTTTEKSSAQQQQQHHPVHCSDVEAVLPETEIPSFVNTSVDEEADSHGSVDHASSLQLKLPHQDILLESRVEKHDEEVRISISNGALQEENPLLEASNSSSMEETSSSNSGEAIYDLVRGIVRKAPTGHSTRRSANPTIPSQSKKDDQLRNEISLYDKLIRAGRVKESLEILEMMEEEGTLDMTKVYHSRFFQECKAQRAVAEAFAFARLIKCPTLSTFNMLLSVCCSAADTDGAFTAFAAMKKRGFSPDCKLYTTLISTCGKALKIELMFQVFHEMEKAGIEGNVHTYGAMIDGCARTGQVAKAFGLYGNMKSKKIRPDVVIFNSLINACARSGQVQRAFEVLQELNSHERPFRPNHVTMCSLINACAQAGEADSAYEAYIMMRRKGIKASREVYTAVVHACSHTGDLERAFAIYTDLQNDGVKPDEVFFSALIDVAGHAKDIEKAFHIVEEVEKWCLTPGAITFSSLMGVCSNTGNWMKAFELHQSILKAGIRPTTSTLNALLTALCRGEQLRSAVESFQEMREAGVRANELSYAILLEACERENAADIALELYRQATSDKMTPTLSICENVVALCLMAIQKRSPPPSLPAPLSLSTKPNDEGPHEQWMLWALAVYRQTILGGATPTLRLLSQLLGCLRYPETAREENNFSTSQILQANNFEPAPQLVDGFGVYDPRASALYKEASALGIVPAFKFDTHSITFEASLPVYVAEVCFLTILKALRHRSAIDAALPSLQIKYCTEEKQVAWPDGSTKAITVATRSGLALAALLRRLKLKFNGKESYGRLRIPSAVLQRWFKPAAKQSQIDAPMSPPSLLGKNISQQRRAIRMGIPLPQRPRKR